MKNKLFLLSILASGLCVASLAAQPEINPLEQARQHPIELNKPAVDFFEGAVLGNGGMGVVVTTRPDAIQFHFGHNNVWDIRVAENNQEKTGTFAEIMARVKALPPELKSIRDDEWFNNYFLLMRENYAQPYPRPFPCGTVVLGFDRGKAELLGHKIDIFNGICEVFLLVDGKRNTLQLFTDMTADVLWFRLLDANGQPAPSCFNRLRVIPDTKTPRDFPAYSVKEGQSLGFTQIMPYQTPDKYDKVNGHPKDRAFSLEAKLSAGLENGIRHLVSGQDEPLRKMERYIVPDSKPFLGCVALTEGLAADVKTKPELIPAPTPSAFDAASQKSVRSWTDYWSKSSVKLADKFLEAVWYWNLYFFNCSVKEGVTCPGLFANWSLGDIGTAWHGDYHMNYNTQQPFWLPFSTNHLEKNLPYVDMVHHLLPVSEKWAKEYYGMRGAFFPHSAYPVDMTYHPYPLPDWGWEVFETPWTVQGLWWHYIYSMDTEFLKNRAYDPIKKAILFLVDYMKRPDAHGSQWNDDRYHIFPSVPPELYSLQPGFKYNYDTQCDLTLTKFIFNAFIEAVSVLKLEKQEKALLKDVKEILSKMPEYSTAQSAQYGEIYTSVPGETDKMVYNLPANLLHVFPGEEYGIDAPADVKQKLLNTLAAHRNEGGNDLVSLNMIAVRLGALDVEKFKRQINYCLLPNKTAADFCMQGGGRYDDNTSFNWMGGMGMWFENFALPLVINECMMQSYDGRIRLFPNWDMKQDAAFTTLRAAGAFLVSASLSNRNITNIRIVSEKGSECKLINPFGALQAVTLIRNGKPAETLSGELLTFKTGINETIELTTKN
ncbi:MAG: glycoside hydrolase N-terminal domain-containing protein [Tannerella sp.]|jgi:hypothetical protein|nr:glycoside hydrolase N-terminal domain-containing protein [Tannerella sp.]